MDFSDFVSATRDLSPNFIKLKNSIQKVYDSQSILINCMIMCGKLISYEYNSENLDTTADLSKFHIFVQISMTQRSYVHCLGYILYKISFAIPFDGK